MCGCGLKYNGRFIVGHKAEEAKWDSFVFDLVAGDEKTIEGDSKKLKQDCVCPSKCICQQTIPW